MRTSSKAEQQQKKNQRNNRKLIGNLKIVKIVIQGLLKAENLMNGRNFRDRCDDIDFGVSSTTAAKN